MVISENFILVPRWDERTPPNNNKYIYIYIYIYIYVYMYLYKLLLC